MKNNNVGGSCIVSGENIINMDFCPCICEDEDDEYYLGEKCGWYSNIED